MSQLTTRKSLDGIVAGAGEGRGLVRSLGPFSLIGLGIGCIIGAGIFVLTGKAAASYAGPAISLSFVLAGIACAFVGLCYAELASMLPVAGSAYTYAYATIGEIFAWIIGWDLILEYAMGASTVAVGWSGYLVSLLDGFGLHIPRQWAEATGQAVTLND
ncbi:MAG TPA: amino acid permease, partial [Acetobacteraceae bacterium]|nr:amino acid permease [Acetobacteraceae bacterium]